MGEALENSSSTSLQRVALRRVVSLSSGYFLQKPFPQKKDAGVNVVNHILIIFLLENTDIKIPVFMSIEKKGNLFSIE